MTAQTALRVGLVTEVVPDDLLRARAAELAGEIAARRPDGIQGTVRAMWEARDLPPTLAARHGMSYTHIGNASAVPDSLNNKKKPRTR
jgi:enoyl-CoA hydratase/carnithine racemase